MRNFVMRLTALAAMALVVGAGAYQFSQTTASASAQLCSNSCYISCRNASRFCRDHPDGYWDNGYAGGPCSDFTTTDFCCKWECPNNTPKFSKCVENPMLTGCAMGDGPGYRYCESGFQSDCWSRCQADIPNKCPSGRGACAQAVVSSIDSISCACSFTIECYN